MIPLTRFAATPDGLHIAYQVFGSGDKRLVFAPRFVSSIGYMWEIPEYARFLSGLGDIATVLALDVRGTGLSDRNLPGGEFSLEARMLDLKAVMAAEDWERASLLGAEDGGSLCALYAATDPHRVDRLILHSTYARASWAEDYPWGWTDSTWDTYRSEIDEGWGDPKWVFDQARWIAPSKADDEEFLRRLIRMYHIGASYQTVRDALRVERHLDIRDVLPLIQAPTLVMYPVGNTVESPEQGRYLAETIPDARFVEIPGSDLEIFLQGADTTLEEIHLFLTGTRPALISDRVLAAVMVTDIVGSTELAASLGDRAWTRLLETHREHAGAALARYGGELVDTAGDGLLATFDGPARAVRCAQDISSAAPSLGIDIRAGVHVGEIERLHGDIAGIAVHIGARIAARATAREILVSSTVKDLVAGSGLVFEEAGEHELKGVPDRWRLFRVVD